MSADNLSPQIMMRVMKEIKQLVTKPPEGIRVQFSEENITSITAEIDGPESTPFEGGVFKVRLSLPSDFPSSAPKGTFLTKIFHPNVSKTGEICVNTLKRDWKPELGIRHVLLVVRCLLIHPNPASALNEEAGKLILDAYEDFARHAKLITTIHAKAKKSSSSSSSSSSEGKQALKAASSSSSNTLNAPSSQTDSAPASTGGENVVTASTKQAAKQKGRAKAKRRGLRRL